MIVTIIVARNEEKFIKKNIKSLKGQSIIPYIIVVNDGSTDKTFSIAKKYADKVISLPYHKGSWVGKPKLARVFNAGFKEARKLDPEYIFISGADAAYPKNYISFIVKNMKEEDVVIASGKFKKEKTRVPRGTGRIIDCNFFKKIGYKYPENYGFEAYVIFKALSLGYKVKVYDIPFKLLRRTRMNYRKAYYYGKGMKALNYYWLYALGRILKIGIKNPILAYFMLRGYLSYVKKYDDLNEFVAKHQKIYILKSLKI